MRTVLVTAAGGNAGKAAVAALLATGFKVIATARDPAKFAAPDGVEVRVYEAGGQTDFEALLAGVDDIVLIGPPLDGQIFEKLSPIIDAAAERKIGQLVYLSGNYLSGVTGKTLEALYVRKVEQRIIASGLKHTLVRAGFFMDNYLSGFYWPMVEKGNLVLATGSGKSALIAAADVGAFMAQALSQGLTGEYIVTGPEALDHFEVVELLSRKTGHSITYTPIGESDLRAIYEARGLPAQTIDYGLTLYRAFRNYTTAAITDGFQQAAGREPMSFKAFLGLD